MKLSRLPPTSPFTLAASPDFILSKKKKKKKSQEKEYDKTIVNEQCHYIVPMNVLTTFLKPYQCVLISVMKNTSLQQPQVSKKCTELWRQIMLNKSETTEADLVFKFSVTHVSKYYCHIWIQKFTVCLHQLSFRVKH